MKKITAIFLAVVLSIASVTPVFAAGSTSEKECSIDVKNVIWQVLYKSGSEALLISKYVLEDSYYDDSKEYTLWENSSLRTYLNDSFYGEFSDAQRKHIIAKEYENTEITNSNGSLEYRANNATTDAVSILSVEEFATYFTIHNYGYNALYAYSMDAICSYEDTTYSYTIGEDLVSRVSGYTNRVVGKKASPWFLRNTSPDGTAGLVASCVWAVDISGATHPYITDVTMGIRPVIWVDASALTDGSFLIDQTSVGTNPDAKGSLLSSGKNLYEVTKKGKEVAYAGTTGSATKLKIKGKVTIDGKTYKVTSIAANAFKGNKKIKSVTIADSVKKIGKNAFSGCKNLKTITFGKGLTSVGKNALKGINKSASLKVPADKLKAYKKLLKNKGQGKKVSITAADD